MRHANCWLALNHDHDDQCSQKVELEARRLSPTCLVKMQKMGCFVPNNAQNVGTDVGSIRKFLNCLLTVPG